MLFNSTKLRKYFSIGRLHQLLLVAFVALAAYYPVIFGELCSVDDVKMVSTYRGVESWTLREVFTPGWTQGVYYRPIMILSYLFDNYLFHLDEVFLHLENIVFHIINAFLVYWLAYQLLAPDKKNTSYAPLVAALIFALHPINTESVCWISGRTDILACAFVLFSTNFLLLFKQKQQYRFLLASGAFMLMGFLTKESALAFLPGALLILIAVDNQMDGQSRLPNHSLVNPSVKNTLYALVGIAAVAVFILLRSHAIITNDSSKIGFTIKVIFLDFPDAAMVVLNAFVFYLKIIFAPFPLNFTIIEIDPLYEFLGLPIVMLSLSILSKRSLLSGVFMSGIFLIAPAFLIAFNQIAWTPYAERYVYIPSAFIVVATVLFVSSRIGNGTSGRFWIGAVTMLMLIVLSSAVFQRSTVWKTNLTLFQDVVKKNPILYSPRVSYGFALIDDGQLENARTQFLRANKDGRASVVIKKYNKKGPMDSSEIKASFYQNRFGYWDDADLGLAYILEREGKTAEAISAYSRIVGKSGGQSAEARKRLVYLYIDMLAAAKTNEKASLIKSKLVHYTHKWNTARHADGIYRIGKILYSRGDIKGASFFFKKAHDVFAEDNEYKSISEKIILNLQKERT